MTQTLDSVTGGECLSPALQTMAGSMVRGTLQISQIGSSLTAIFTPDDGGSSCTYTGSAGESSVALDVVSCTASDLADVACPGSSARRDLVLQKAGISASVESSTATGTSAETYTVFTAGTASAMGILRMNSSFSATRR